MRSSIRDTARLEICFRSLWCENSRQKSRIIQPENRKGTAQELGSKSTLSSWAEIGAYLAPTGAEGPAVGVLVFAMNTSIQRAPSQRILAFDSTPSRGSRLRTSSARSTATDSNSAWDCER